MSDIKVISTTVRQASYALDGLLYHETDLAIQEHYTDTLGYTDHVFALCHLLGFRFAPRIRQFNHQRLYIFEKASTYPLSRLILGAELRSTWCARNGTTFYGWPVRFVRARSPLP